jgi:hypothetical protein
MKIKLLFLLILFPAFVFSQTKIRGKVLDKETQKPVSDVIIHSGSKISITNDKGEYDFEINQSETVYFRHLSYNLFKIQSDSLQNKGEIYLTPYITELSEVVISPNRATYLLDKAIRNLYANFQKEKTKTHYLIHVEGNTTTGAKKDVYTLIECIIAGKKKAQKRINWDIQLTKLDRLYNLNESDFTVNGKLLSLYFFPDGIEFVDISSNAKYEIYDDNDKQLTIKMSPKSLDNDFYCFWTINKSDTILTEFIAQIDADLTQENYKGISYYTSNHFEKMEFTKDGSGTYYLSKYQEMVCRNVLTENPYEVVLMSLAYPVNVSPDEIKKKKKIILAYDGALFKSKLPDSPGFWKKYLKP